MLAEAPKSSGREFGKKTLCHLSTSGPSLASSWVGGMELGHLEHLVSEQAGDRCATGVSEKRCYERRVPTDSHRSSVTMCRVPDYRIVMHCLYLQANLRPFMQRFIKGESPSASLLGLLGLPQQSPRKTAPVNLPPAPHVPIGASPGTVVGDLPRLQQQHLVEARAADG